MPNLKNALIHRINEALSEPKRYTYYSLNVLKQIATYLDGNSTKIVALILNNYLYNNVYGINICLDYLIKTLSIRPLIKKGNIRL